MLSRSFDLAARLIVGSAFADRSDRLQALRAVRNNLLEDARAHGLPVVRWSPAKPTWNLQCWYRLAEATVPSSRLISRALRYVIQVRLRSRNYLLPFNVFGPGLCIVHLGGLVVNERATIGARCRVHQFVTIGSWQGKVPTIAEDVWIGPGVVIAGGVTIGRGAFLGANVVIRRNVAAGERVIAPEPLVQGRSGRGSQ